MNFFFAQIMHNVCQKKHTVPNVYSIVITMKIFLTLVTCSIDVKIIKFFIKHMLNMKYKICLRKS